MGAAFLRREARADWRPVERSCFVDTKNDLKATTKVMKRPLFQSKAEQMAILAETLSVSADELIGREAPKSKANGPTGKLRLIFQRASELPRTQQAKVAEFVEAFVEQQTKTS